MRRSRVIPIFPTIGSSRNPNFAVVDIAVGYRGWQDYAVENGSGLRKLNPAAAPVSTALGVLGMPGMTAYAGLLEIGRPQTGETVAVAAASGAFGSVVGQIAKIKGCCAVGIAGDLTSARFVVGEGFDACVDHRAGDFVRQLEAACPAGIDISPLNIAAGWGPGCRAMATSRGNRPLDWASICRPMVMTAIPRTTAAEVDALIKAAAVKSTCDHSRATSSAARSPCRKASKIIVASR
jgi:hypothetical protein